MPRIIAIGDIHGCARTFQKLLDKLQIRKADTIYLLGDYIDRGPDSKKVIDIILDSRKQGYQIRTLRGNHEELMMNSLKNKDSFDSWYRNGGDTTLKSFGVKSYKDLNPEYKRFFNHTRFYFENGPYIFVHAGINFAPDDIFEDRDSLLWIRNFTVDKRKLGDRKIIHGHTPITIDEVTNPEHESVYNIDGGCVHVHREDYGYLVALDVTARKWYVVRNCE